MSSGNNTDAYGREYRKGGGGSVGESMPGTIGDSEGVLHDANGYTPTSTPDIEVPADNATETEEKTDTGGLSVKELVKQRS
ncbi:hypothetical protein NDI56_04580 [Haloarcula sp. S1CR25-12]|uniref:Uncharacterized protein n=1 Tax=Haloarcula saliterrae TaxID=2950534 RepID=A0ABU2FA14_9EURY|nr:hypothetical protein [Haloarcula sp. S1CR25-12]MDS0258685.1 hypothetical protein [Haloarcula sp. S1CR25-12]